MEQNEPLRGTISNITHSASEHTHASFTLANYPAYSPYFFYPFEFEIGHGMTLWKCLLVESRAFVLLRDCRPPKFGLLSLSLPRFFQITLISEVRMGPRAES